MAEPFIGEIRLMSFDFAPKGWARCDGQLYPINQNQALFALIGTIYGGNGQTNFALPDLRGRVAIFTGNGHTLGERAGTEAVTLTPQQIPKHSHQLYASRANGDDTFPGAFASVANTYGPPTNSVGVGSAPTQPPPTISPSGSAPHDNMAPYGVITFCIALQGIFPSPN